MRLLAATLDANINKTGNLIMATNDTSSNEGSSQNQKPQDKPEQAPTGNTGTKGGNPPTGNRGTFDLKLNKK